MVRGLNSLACAAYIRPAQNWMEDGGGVEPLTRRCHGFQDRCPPTQASPSRFMIPHDLRANAFRVCREAGPRTGIPDELAILHDRPDMHASVRRVVNGEREQRWMLRHRKACNDLHGALLVRARRIELRRHAVMSCGPSHLARRAKLVRVRSSAFRRPPSKGGTLLTSFTLMSGDRCGERSRLTSWTVTLPHLMHKRPWCAEGDSNSH
jgi:hypothetical protein